jgi:hypothetical protein
VPVRSIFRDDTNPNCWFSYDYSGKLRFVDFANTEVRRGIRMSHLDCFNVVQLYYNLPNERITLMFIKQKLIDNKVDLHQPVPVAFARKKSFEFRIAPFYRPFSAKDALFWKKFQIKREHLVEDSVFSLHSASLLNTKSGNVFIMSKDYSYCYSGFPSGRFKLYYPYRKTKRFITDTTNDDVGGLHNLSVSGNTLIIQKSYKDYRVVKNQGFEVVWFQSEGQIPQEKVLYDLVKRFTNVIVWFDNDRAGIKGAEAVVEAINSLIPQKASSFHIPTSYNEKGKIIKDPAEFIETKPNIFKYFIQKELK